MWMDNWVLNLPFEAWPTYGPERLPVLFRFFETQQTVVVLSSSNSPDKEVNLEACQHEHVPILRRKGGGGTVVLGPGCLVLTFAFYAKDPFGNEKYFRMINTLWMEALATAGCTHLSLKGISDIAHGDKKIAGTSLFRKKHLLVYQGSLLVDPDLLRISRLLVHPSREPDYRAGRSHLSFLTTAQNAGCFLSTSLLAEHCRQHFIKHVATVFTAERFFH